MDSEGVRMVLKYWKSVIEILFQISYKAGKRSAMDLEFLQKDGPVYTDSGSLIYSNLKSVKSDWDVVVDEKDDPKSRFQYSKKQTVLEAILLAIYVICLLVIFYLFACALTLFGYASQLMAAHIISAIFFKANLLKNPLVGVSIGNLISALIQSTDACLRLVLSLLDNDKISHQDCVPIIFGINMGNTMLCVVIAVTLIYDRHAFRRTIGTAILTTCFYFWAVLILLPIERVTGFHYHIVENFIKVVLVPKLNPIHYDFLGVQSVVKFLIDIDIKKWAQLVNRNHSIQHVESIVRRYCPEAKSNSNVEVQNECNAKGDFVLDFQIPDIPQGLVMAIVLIPVICGLAFLIVNCVKSTMQFKAARKSRQFLSSFRVKTCSYGGFAAITAGFFVEFIFTDSQSVLTFICLLVGAKYISFALAYPFILGVNLSFSVIMVLRISSEFGLTHNVLFITLINLLFNMNGIIILYAIPWPRLPLLSAEYLGDHGYIHRLFCILLIFLWFIVIPLTIILLAYANVAILAMVTVPIFIFILISILICFMQIACPETLPEFIRNWSFMPIWLRSLEPYENCCKFKGFKILPPKEIESSTDVYQYMESKPGESISVVMNRIRKESVFQPTNVLLKQAVDTTGTQFSMSKLNNKRKRTVYPIQQLVVDEISSSEGTLIEKYTPYPSGAATPLHYKHDSIGNTSDSSSVKILTPYATTKFRVHQRQKTRKPSEETLNAQKLHKESGEGESYISVNEDAEVIEDLEDTEAKSYNPYKKGYRSKYDNTK